MDTVTGGADVGVIPSAAKGIFVYISSHVCVSVTDQGVELRVIIPAKPLRGQLKRKSSHESCNRIVNAVEFLFELRH